MRQGFQAQRRVEQLGAVDEGVAVKPAEPGEFGVFEPGNGAEDACLLGMAQLGLEADDVVERAERIVLAKLHYRIGPSSRPWIGEADGLHRTVAQGLGAARGHDFDRQATVEIGRVLFPFVESDLIGGEKCGNEGVILVAVERTVEVVRAVALVVARLAPHFAFVDRLGIDDRRDRIEKRQSLFARLRADRSGEIGCGEWAGRDDDAPPFRWRQRADGLAPGLRQRAETVIAFGLLLVLLAVRPQGIIGASWEGS